MRRPLSPFDNNADEKLTLEEATSAGNLKQVTQFLKLNNLNIKDVEAALLISAKKGLTHISSALIAKLGKMEDTSSEPTQAQNEQSFSFS